MDGQSRISVKVILVFLGIVFLIGGVLLVVAIPQAAAHKPQTTCIPDEQCIVKGGETFCFASTNSTEQQMLIDAIQAAK